MPVYSEYLREPTQQDQDALAKLYPNDAEALIDAAKKGRLLLIGGRFNGSLISALTLTPIHGGDYELARLTVRDITRRRGTARQLLIQCMKDLPDDLRSMSADISKAPELSSLLTELGFENLGHCWQWQRPQS
ncbi:MULTISPECIES: acetyl-CoA sensor PanZ family protein [Spongiibacter]|uniref:acetyl-CoA sensor PanZ family protein n=1 Tax=Spongiibacter TaxID=630749 RepID=UPI000C67A769|nr:MULTISPECIES: acetyl-CoA sensor PanZ family protein [Spongiibacter]MAY38647.1 hypothetical protein [Spongiibacter sp.]MBI58846.1 hypothetical protein [Spongiibacter sp.]MBO6752818.1 acetyl-CoA sensor PanZ family protein [Spongiibacter sp.]|tara:strand:- start:3310 stop:3708 length:399 start_codon:yes stop_codon:yes gene_type:complete